jgi:hypothetical protein
MANTKKKTKTTRITKTDRLRMAAEKTRPTGITVAVGRQYEVEIVPMYDPFTHKRMAGVRADQWGDPDDTAAPTVYMDSPHQLRILAQALNRAADWMEEEIK